MDANEYSDQDYSFGNEPFMARVDTAIALSDGCLEISHNKRFENKSYAVDRCGLQNRLTQIVHLMVYSNNRMNNILIQTSNKQTCNQTCNVFAILSSTCMLCGVKK